MTLTPIYLALAALLAGFYLARVGDPPGRTRTLIKTLSVVALALVAAIGGGFILLVLALLLCAVGDFFLARKSEASLKAGMAAFAAGHLVYIGLFINQGGGLGYDALRVAMQIAVAASAFMVARWVWPDLGALRRPVAAYMVIVAAMTLLAIGLPPSLWLVSIGAILFMTSDALLAGELFKLPPNSPSRSWTSPAVWTLYWSGQALITAGFLYPVK